MLVSYQWLNDYVDITDVTAKELGEKLSVTGIEVEGVENAASGLKKIVVGHVLTCVPHPDSDHLHITTVEVDDGVVNQIVCGAPNVAAGQKVIVALPGARIADNVKIKKGKMRGVESLGMICSLQELGISENVVPKEVADGIFIMPADAPVGADVMDYLGLNDDIVELSITPNRADALSMIGTAYEVGAVYGRPVEIPTPIVHEVAEKTASKISATVLPDSGALTYHLRVVDNVTVAPSPLWMQMLLIKEGIRPINNVVDVTNYVLLEYGQPMHAFDYDALGSKEILVRHANAAEKLTTLDGVERELDPADIVITNGKIPVALGGVMGGLDSEITASTKTVVLESAVFDGLSIRLTGKRHNLRSESSARFEKGINQGSVLRALDRAANLIQDLAGGGIYAGVVTGAHTEPVLPVVSVTLDQINGYLGTELTDAIVSGIFAQLNFPTEVANHTFTVTVPTRRWDIAIAADLIEEVARIYGYDKLPTTLPKGETTLGSLTRSQKLTRVLRQTLNGAALQENISYALVTEEEALRFAFEKSNVTRLMWPMSEDHAVLRQNVVSGLLNNISFNLARKNQNVAVYEIGRIFYQTGDPTKVLPVEKERLAIAMTGNYPDGNWQEKAQPVDFYTLKGIMERIFAEFGVKNYSLVAKTEIAALHPGRSGEIYLGEELAGFIGQVHPQVADALDLTPTYVMELDLAKLFAHTTNVTYIPVSKFPAVKRDQAILVDETVTNAQVVETMKHAGGKLLQDVVIFDVYQGKNIAEGKKSLAYSLTFSTPTDTLTDEQINASTAKIQTALVEKLDAVLR